MHIVGFQSIYRVLFMICSLAAIPLRGYPYCFCLFYVFLNVDVVQYIVIALTRSRELKRFLFVLKICLSSCNFSFSGKQLFFVALIGLAVFLVFAIGAFVFVHDYFEPSTPLFCNTLWECFISVAREGLLDTLGVVSLQVSPEKLIKHVLIIAQFFVDHSIH